MIWKLSTVRLLVEERQMLLTLRLLLANVDAALMQILSGRTHFMVSPESESSLSEPQVEEGHVR